ncbi:uncharacterized protein [Eleutherodactylus coqui]|uniref:uncharacterized protein n=1 Tax=Eleutherodactylus coqui TaxID=57060 RepID=UPI003463002E
MAGIAFLFGVLVSLGNAIDDTPEIVRGHHHIYPDPTQWEDTGKALNLTFIEGVTSTILVDMCQLMSCGDHTAAKKLTWADKYICFLDIGTECTGWSQALWTTAAQDWGYTMSRTDAQSLKKRLSVIKAVNSPCTHSKDCNQLLITLQNPILKDQRLFAIGAWVSGINPIGHFFIQVIQNKTKYMEVTKTQSDTMVEDFGDTIRFTNLTMEDQLALEVGYEEKNKWLEWLRYTAHSLRKENCIICATARPHLGTIPFPLSNATDPEGLKCMIKLFNSTYTPQISDPCYTLSLLFPPVSGDQIPPAVVSYPGNYTCFALPGNGTEADYERLPKGYCAERITVEGTLFSGIWPELQRARADVWWLCGDRRLKQVPGTDLNGDCALVQLIMPVYLMTSEGNSKGRVRRTRDTSPKGSFDANVYIDTIGVPRGIPDEYKARNQVAAGFESLLAWWVTVNKNVDWINYIYYNQQRFVNYTRDAIKGLAEQLGPTSLIAWQNRMALDMLLAEKGGVCKMIGGYCCTFIPNNTAPDGSVTRALEGLNALSNELAENSGINHPFTDWLENLFGHWSQVIYSTLVSMSVFASILVLCGCCCIPCIRGLLQNLINTSITKTMFQNIQDDEEQDDLLGQVTTFYDK